MVLTYQLHSHVTLQKNKGETSHLPLLSFIISQDIVERATGPNGTTISFEVSAEDDSDGEAVPVNCDHNPGKTFPIGETIVRCTAEDSLGNGAEEYFNIAVQDAGTPEIKK